MKYLMEYKLFELRVQGISVSDDFMYNKHNIMIKQDKIKNMERDSDEVKIHLLKHVLENDKRITDKQIENILPYIKIKFKGKRKENSWDWVVFDFSIPYNKISPFFKKR